MERIIGVKRSVPTWVSTVSGVVIFAGTSGEYFAGAAGAPVDVGALLMPGAIAIVVADEGEGGS